MPPTHPHSLARGMEGGRRARGIQKQHQNFFAFAAAPSYLPEGRLIGGRPPRAGGLAPSTTCRASACLHASHPPSLITKRKGRREEGKGDTKAAPNFLCLCCCSLLGPLVAVPQEQGGLLLLLESMVEPAPVQHRSCRSVGQSFRFFRSVLITLCTLAAELVRSVENKR